MENTISDSVQLQGGQKFHHQGKNGVVYFSLEVKEMPDGSIYPMTKTALACNVLPIVCDNSGMVTHVYLMEQKGRPEAPNESVLKAGGSFCNVGETGREGALRSLEQKMGMSAKIEDLIPVGKSYGFGPQFSFPIELFVLKEFSIIGPAPMPGCTLERLSIEDLAYAQRDRKFFNSETVDLVATVLLRNTNRENFVW